MRSSPDNDWDEWMREVFSNNILQLIVRNIVVDQVVLSSSHWIDNG